MKISGKRNAMAKLSRTLSFPSRLKHFDRSGPAPGLNSRRSSLLSEVLIWNAMSETSKYGTNVSCSSHTCLGYLIVT